MSTEDDIGYLLLLSCSWKPSVSNKKRRERVVLFGSHFGASPRVLAGEVQIFNRKNHETEKHAFGLSKVVSTHLWNTPLNLYQQTTKGFLS